MGAARAVEKHHPSGFCDCACHRGGPVVHPVPCCSACDRCGLAIPNGVTHRCRGAWHPEALAQHGRSLVGRLTRYDLIFSAFIALAVMGLAIFSLPYPGYLILLGAALLGAVFGSAMILRGRARVGAARQERNGT